MAEAPGISAHTGFPNACPIDWLQKVAIRAFMTVHLMGPYGRTSVNP